MTLASGKAAFREELSKIRDQHERRRRQVAAALAQSPAVTLTKGDFTELVIVSGEVGGGDYPWRATTFLVDGPWGHQVYRTEAEIADALAHRSWDRIEAASDDDVMEWTSTPEFVHGAKVVAYVQAANALRYWAAQKRDRGLDDRISQLLRRTDAMNDVEEATKIVEGELRQVAPRENPVPNPAWVTKSLADAYETMIARVPAEWLPRLSEVRASRGQVTGKIREYGCGNYGCVLPTLDPGVVIKVTTDDTEAEFAAELSHTLEAPVCVTYHRVMRLPQTRNGRGVYLLWRESAEAVGELERELGEIAGNLVEIQHAASQDVLHLILAHAPADQISAALSAWLDTCEQMADQEDVPELQSLGRGMATVFHHQRIFFGDVHAGNLGRVDRDGHARWVITDPGNVIVFGSRTRKP